MKIIKYGDIGTPEILKRKGLKIVVVEGQQRARVSNISPIESMYDRGYLSLAQYDAGKQLYEYWVMAWGENHSYEVRERVDGSTKEREISTRQIHAMKQYERGMRACKHEKVLVEQVILQEISINAKDARNGYRRAQLMFRLKQTLDILADVYGCIAK